MTVTASTPLWIACRELLAAHAEKFFSEWEKATESYEEEDVHDFRVASRRLREALALFSPGLPPKKTKRVAKQVKKVTRILGNLRNTDEAFLFFSKLAPKERSKSADELDELLSALRREREEAHSQLKQDMAAIDPAPLRQELQALQDRPNLFANSASDPFAAFSFFAAGAIMDRGEPIAELLAQALHEDDGAAQHRLRIAIKKLRYRVEITEPLIRSGYDEMREVLKGYQDVLGKLHDVDVFREMVQERVGETTGREELLAVMARRRTRLYQSFLKMLQHDAVTELAKKAKDALG
jgi:CHAD domain-containing protein